ncbi:MAG: leucine-rich repeat domain-containing protein [Bacteroidales bacterium]|nr:leucine-rich repeat domain-containing protein [Bacteroidales bacterium]
MRHRTILPIFLLLIWMMDGQCQLLSEAELKKKPVFTSIEEASESPEEVYRMKLKIKADSLPDELFQFTNLQELVVSHCKLSVLNARIGELTQLQRLDVSANHLVVLPESICQLKNLKDLIINRNIIAALPQNIGNMVSLEYIDAWNNPLYVLPESIAALREVLREIDIRQVELWDEELEAMEKLLPNTKIQYTSTCDCHGTRDK